MKKISFVLLTLLFIFFPISCKEEVEFMQVEEDIYFEIDINKDGSIQQKFSFPTQINLIDINEEKQQEYIQTLTREIKSKLFFPFFLNFYSTSTLGNLKFKIGEDLKYQEPIYNEKLNTVSFTFDFKNAEVWNFFHPSNEDEKSLKIIKGIFLSKGQTESNFLFSEKLNLDHEEMSYGEYLSNILSTAQSEFEIEEVEKPGFSYVYTHYSTKLHTNADKVIHTESGNKHIWHSDFDTLSDEKTIEIYIYNPNRTIWYISAVCAVLSLMGCAILIYKLKTKKREEKK